MTRPLMNNQRLSIHILSHLHQSVHRARINSLIDMLFVHVSIYYVVLLPVLFLWLQDKEDRFYMVDLGTSATVPQHIATVTARSALMRTRFLHEHDAN